VSFSFKFVSFFLVCFKLPLIVLVFGAHILCSKLVCCTVPVTKPRFVKFQIIQPKALVLKVTLKEMYQVSIVLENSVFVKQLY